jgi:hypothetical protein
MKIDVEEKGKDKEATPAPVEAKPKVDSENNKKVHAFLVQRGKDGAQASDIAIHLDFIGKDEDSKSPEFKMACKKVRKIARDVVDNDPKGSREVRNGRQKIYQIA